MRKVAICGWAPSWQKAPWDDPSWEKWVISDMYRVIGDRFQRLYEVHSPTQLAQEMADKGIPENHVEILSQFEDRVHTIHSDRPDLPRATLINVPKMVEAFGAYFTCSVSYMVADAILEHVDEIGIWGVDLAVDTEYTYERPGVEYMIGQAKGRGIDVYLPPQSDLLKASHMYGTDNPQYTEWVANIMERITNLEAKRQEIYSANQMNNNSLLSINGALEILYYDRKTWTLNNGSAPRDIPTVEIESPVMVSDPHVGAIES